MTRKTRLRFYLQRALPICGCSAHYSPVQQCCQAVHAGCVVSVRFTGCQVKASERSVLSSIMHAAAAVAIMAMRATHKVCGVTVWVTAQQLQRCQMHLRYRLEGSSALLLRDRAWQAYRQLNNAALLQGLYTHNINMYPCIYK